MAVVAPIVEYWRLVDDGTGTGAYTFADTTAATLLDFGTVDAGTNTYEGTAANITKDLASCQVYAIFNAKGATTASSDMQNTVLSVVSNESGHEGSKQDVVYEKSWVNVLMNKEDVDSSAVALGNVTGTEVTKKLTAIGLDASVTGNEGTIKGTANDGTLANAGENYCIIKTWVDLPPNAAAGPHHFRLRTTYSYT